MMDQLLFLCIYFKGYAIFKVSNEVKLKFNHEM